MAGPVSQQIIPTPKDLSPSVEKADKEHELWIQQQDLQQCENVKGVVHGIFDEISFSGKPYVSKPAIVERPDSNACFQNFLKDLRAKNWTPIVSDKDGVKDVQVITHASTILFYRYVDK